MSDAEHDRRDDDTITQLLQDAECVLDINPGSLHQGKRALQAWMAGDDTGRPETDDRSTGPTYPPGAHPQFIAWNADLTLKPPGPPRRPTGDAPAQVRRAVGDHAHAAPSTGSRRRRGAGRDEAAEAALHAVSELRTHLMLRGVATHIQRLQSLLAAAEEEITRTGHLSARLHRQLRTVLTDATLDPALRASAGIVARLLEGE